MSATTRHPPPNGHPPPTPTPGIDLPHTPPTGPSRPYTLATSLPTPPSSIQKYSIDLRRAISARFEAVSIAGHDARLPPDAAHDPDYGYDEDPFDTRAKLLLSLGDQDIPPLPSGVRPVRRVLSLGDDDTDDQDDTTTSGHRSRKSLDAPAAISTGPNSPPPPHEMRLDSPPLSLPPMRAAFNRPRSVSMTSIASSYDDDDEAMVDTPGSMISLASEASFEAGRSSDYLQAYGEETIPRAPPSPRPASRPSSRPTSMLFDTVTNALRPLTQMPAGSHNRVQALQSARRPTLGRRQRSRSRPYPDATDPWDEATAMGRTPSETMILAAGFASQRGRATTRCPGGVI
ncbi:hypothetical protein Q8F55_005641 [Vanrija albida]|uniref:Uncharacterized protein n=1 Tax=Vanrija albida TaxID=181172 RepID=A0ABR3Q2S1_9TREE